MNDDQIQPSASQTAPPPAQHPVSDVLIRPASNVSTPGKAKPPAQGECVRPYVNDQLNSRVFEPLPAGTWNVRWEATLEARFPLSFVLQGADRIVVQGSVRWLLFDLQGHLVHMDNFGPSDVVLDPVNRLFYVADGFGVVEAHRISDGAVVYAMPFSGGAELQRDFIVRRGRDCAVVSYQRPRSPRLSINGVAIEAHDLGDPISIKNEALSSSHRTGRFYLDAPYAWGAALPPVLVVAMPNEILITDFGKSIRARLTGTFDVGPISLDETARIYALIARADQTLLWAITLQGERVFAFDSPEPSITQTPPVVGYDHRIFLTAGQSILCLSPEGKLLWQNPAGGTVAGMIVTPDDQLIVSAGSSLVAFDAHGTRRLLIDFRGEILSTPPAMMKGGDLLVASANKLYRLTAGHTGN